MMPAPGSIAHENLEYQLRALIAAHRLGSNMGFLEEGYNRLAKDFGSHAVEAMSYDLEGGMNTMFDLRMWRIGNALRNTREGEVADIIKAHEQGMGMGKKK